MFLTLLGQLFHASALRPDEPTHPKYRLLAMAGDDGYSSKSHIKRVNKGPQTLAEDQLGSQDDLIHAILPDGHMVAGIKEFPNASEAEVQTVQVLQHAIPLLPAGKFATKKSDVGFKGCYFNVLSDNFGAYRETCHGYGNNIRTFRGHLTGSQAEGTQTLTKADSPTVATQGEDPRCFVWQARPWCLTWTAMNGKFKILSVDDDKVVLLNPAITDTIGGKNWIPVVSKDGTLYFVVRVSPLNVLRYNGQSNGLGNISWHVQSSVVSKLEVLFRGGTPAAYLKTDNFEGHIGLGHITMSPKRHAIYAYIFSADLKSSYIAKTDLPLREEPDLCEAGIWDPYSVDVAGSDIVFSVQYVDRFLDDAQQYKTYLLRLDKKRLDLSPENTKGGILLQVKDANQTIHRISDSSSAASLRRIAAAWVDEQSDACLAVVAGTPSHVTAPSRPNLCSGSMCLPTKLQFHREELYLILMPLVAILCIVLDYVLPCWFAPLVGFSLCSSGMLVVNKIVISLLPFPWLILACQFLFSAGAVQVWAFADKGIDLEPLMYGRAKAFVPAATVLVALIYFNIKLLQTTKIETFIVFRASAPMVIHMIDHHLLKRSLGLSMRSWCALLGTLACSTIYCFVETGALGKMSTFWLACWYATFVFDHLYVKHVYQTLQMSAQTRVYYTNTLACVPAILLAISSEAAGASLLHALLDPIVVLAVLSSCLTGFSLSYWSARLRDAVSPTSFAHIGNMCKLITLAMVQCIVSDAASFAGHTTTLVGVLFGATYQEPPTRIPPAKDFVKAVGGSVDQAAPESCHPTPGDSSKQPTNEGEQQTSSEPRSVSFKQPLVESW